MNGSPYALGQYSGAVRLWRNGATSSSYTSGRVQVFLGNGWGNVCGDLDASPFRQEEADVTCRNLGYTASSQHSTAEADKYAENESMYLFFILMAHG